MFLKGHGGAKKKFVGEAFNVVRMWEKVKTVGELEKSWGAPEIHGESFRGGCYRGMFCKSIIMDHFVAFRKGSIWKTLKFSLQKRQL